MAVTMGLFSKGYVYGAKAFGYLSRAVGVNNSAARRLVSANKNIFEGSSIDLLRALKRENSTSVWQNLIKEAKGLGKIKHLGVIEKENYYVQHPEFGNFVSGNWHEYIQGLVNSGIMSKNSTYKDLAKAFMKE